LAKDLTGPAGAQGPAGAAGAQGPAGAAGATGPAGTTNASEITAGTLAVANGGTGRSTTPTLATKTKAGTNQSISSTAFVWYQVTWSGGNTYTPGVAGIYAINVLVTWIVGVPANTIYYIGLYVDGALAELTASTSSNVANIAFFASYSTMMTLTAANVLSIYVLHEASGITQGIFGNAQYTYWKIMRLAP
jgi:hypothetical protein